MPLENSLEAEALEQELVSDQRELNGQLVLSSLRAQEEVEAAAAREEALRTTAELRERLLGVIGHDLRTPLGAIMMSAGILVAHGNLTAGDDRVVSRLLNSARRMERIIAQILDFTRSRLGGGVLLDLRPTNVGDICQNVASELSLSRSVSIQCSVDGDVTASLDPDRIADVISNIAGNASEHAREGTSVSVHASDEGAHVVVVISNEGAPIPPEVLPFIFDPFRRARQNEVSKAGNLGLGLYIAHEVTRAHRGSIDVQSADGRTMFTLRLPRFPPPPPSGALKSERG